MWLSKFMSLEHISICTHEATEFAGSAEEFWANAQRYVVKEHEYYGNSDSANILVLQSLLSVQPLTRVVWIERPIEQVYLSMERAGMPFTEDSAKVLIQMRDRNAEYFDLIMDYSELETLAGCLKLWDVCLPGIPFEVGRWGMFQPKKICYSKENPSPEKSFHKFLDWAVQEVGRIPIEEM
jgi:hypothetical protein